MCPGIRGARENEEKKERDWGEGGLPSPLSPQSPVLSVAFQRAAVYLPNVGKERGYFKVGGFDFCEREGGTGVGD